MGEPLLEVKDFSLSLRTFQKGLKEKKLDIIRNLHLTVHEGEIVAIVGASGAGKSLLAHAILGILPDHAETAGEILYKGKKLTKQAVQKIRGREISYIPQTIASLDPLMKAGKQVQLGLPGKKKKEIQEKLFKQVGLSPEAAKKYPFELSGGMARRVLTASAIRQEVKLMIADEPTPGLDPAVLKETMQFVKGLAKEGKGILFITHDIETARKTADRIAVMHAGEMVEIAAAQAFAGKGEQLSSAYAKKLWNALPQHQLNAEKKQKKALPMSEENSLQAKEITFAYPGGPDLFRKLSITVQPGEIVGISGYSGSGKTTMAKVIAGYLRPKEGKITVAGKADFKNRKHPVQLIWQHPEQAVNPRWKMKKVLSEGGRLDPALLERLGIRKEWLARRPSELSGGELQRFCVARALQDETKFIIADEITTMLDAITQQQIWKFLIQLAREQQIGILAISHDEALLKRISDRLLKFEDIRFPKTKAD